MDICSQTESSPMRQEPPLLALRNSRIIVSTWSGEFGSNTSELTESRGDSGSLHRSSSLPASGWIFTTLPLFEARAEARCLNACRPGASGAALLRLRSSCPRGDACRPGASGALLRLQPSCARGDASARTPDCRPRAALSVARVRGVPCSRLVPRTSARVLGRGLEPELLAGSTVREAALGGDLEPRMSGSSSAAAEAILSTAATDGPALGAGSGAGLGSGSAAGARAGSTTALPVREPEMLRA
mmetsp:Transcript_34418/g.106886  ORF Transcript_34418/g.106886 Transcript_34418/m.106886 type:complete len:244 (-) Transcript_34418:270-1001(-)